MRDEWEIYVVDEVLVQAGGTIGIAKRSPRPNSGTTRI